MSRCTVCGDLTTQEEFEAAKRKHPDHTPGINVVLCVACMDEIDAEFNEYDLSLCQESLIERCAKFLKDHGPEKLAECVAEAISRVAKEAGPQCPKP